MLYIIMMKTVITDERLGKACREALARMGFRTILLPPWETLPSPIASHTDMLLFRCGGSIIASRQYALRYPRIATLIAATGAELRLSDEVQGEDYPNDSIFNAAVIGKHLLCKSDTVSRDVLSLAKERGLTPLHTRQGYPACTTLVLDGSHAITSDGGIASLLSSVGVAVLKVSNSGSISLPPYEYGFIGGASGVCGETVYFVGNLASHPDAERIEEFIEASGKRAVSLAPDSDSLLDVGGLIFIDGGTDNDGNDGQQQ